MTQVTDMNSRLYINTFINYAQRIKNLNLPLNKDFIRNFDLPQKCYDYAKKYLDTSIDNLINDKYEIDDREIRTFIREKLGTKILDVLRTSEGAVKLDIEHMLVALAYEKSRPNRSFESTNIIIGLSYLILAHQCMQEWNMLIKSSTRGIIQPNFDCSVNYFTWKRCPYVLRKYAMFLTKPEGYNVYYFEKPNIAQIAYLISVGMSREEANEYMKTTDKGLFFNYLQKDKENLILQEILKDEFYSCNGVFTANYKEEHAKIEARFNSISVYNVFNMNVRPHMIEMIGFVLKGILDELDKNEYSQSDAYVYHLSHYRIGVAVREGIELSEVLPSLYEFMKPVPTPDLYSLVSGAYL